VTAMATLPWEELMGQLPSSLLLTAPSPCRSATHKTQKKTHTHTRASLHSRAFCKHPFLLLLRDWLGQLNPWLEFP
jgi:hypothetical protein